MKVNVQPESMSPLKKEFIKLIEEIPDDVFEKFFIEVSVKHLADMMKPMIDNLFMDVKEAKG